MEALDFLLADQLRGVLLFCGKLPLRRSRKRPELRYR